MSRPFGVALLIGGWGDKGPIMYHTDPSGTLVQCDARAIGSGSEGAQNALQEQYKPDMTLKEARGLAMRRLSCCAFGTAWC